jgi:hypothetical protein
VVWGAALPDARVHLFDEFKMLRLSIKEASEQIRERCLSTWKLGQMPPIYCDPALRIKTGQIGEDYIQTFARHRVILTPVSNNRLAGWQRVHEALREMPGVREPWLTIHPRCKYLIRTFPAMIQDRHNPEDLDTDSDDHGIDAARYLLMGGLRAGSKAMIRTGDVPGSWGAFKRMMRRTA